MLRRTVLSALVAVVALVVPATAADTPGVTATEIKIGNTNPYSGPASAYGTIGKVIGAYFKKVNDEGGVNGRKINYISYDDAYSPPKTVEMVRKLVEQDQVAALFQTLGTPTNSAIHKYMNQQKVPHLFVATGATKWNDPRNFPWTMDWQPNYQTEGRNYAQYIRTNFPHAKNGTLAQNDIAWKPANSLNNVSSSLATVLKPAGLEASKGLITALYMKEITDPQWKSDKGFQDWVAFMKRYYPEGALDDQGNAFGYTVAQA